MPGIQATQPESASFHVLHERRMTDEISTVERRLNQAQQTQIPNDLTRGNGACRHLQVLTINGLSVQVSCNSRRAVFFALDIHDANRRRRQLPPAQPMWMALAFETKPRVAKCVGFPLNWVPIAQPRAHYSYIAIIADPHPKPSKAMNTSRRTSWRRLCWCTPKLRRPTTTTLSPL